MFCTVIISHHQSSVNSQVLLLGTCSRVSVFLLFFFAYTLCARAGEIIREKDRCKKCSGKKVVNESKTLEVHVDKGMRDGQRITFTNEGDQHPDLEPGDVHLVLQMTEHEMFQRQGDTLVMEKKISLTEALCGCQFTIQHLDGRQLHVKSPEGHVIEPGESG